LASGYTDCERATPPKYTSFPEIMTPCCDVYFCSHRFADDSIPNSKLPPSRLAQQEPKVDKLEGEVRKVPLPAPLAAFGGKTEREEER
jgi:hypothetical protein